MHDKKSLRVITTALAMIGGLLYIWQSWFYANHQVSVLDEGAYLVKGLMFANGEYRPFQDFGFLTNHMPLSFLIPGYIQQWFGPGIRTARIFTILLGILFLIGLWVINRRLVGQWWAVFSIWVIALNPALIKMYSIATSQVLAACMIIWILVLVLGMERRPWELMMGAMLAGLLLMTRINLAPVLPFVLFYIFWQHGKKLGVWASIVGIFPVLIGHILFAPGIFRMWANWLPEAITPFLNSWRAPQGTPKWDPDSPFLSRLLSFFQGLRFHFVMMLLAVGTWLLWPKKHTWEERHDFRAAVILTAIFGVLMVAHMGASLGLSYCTFCFPVYQSFYSFLGLVLGGLILKNRIVKMPASRQILALGVIMLVSTGIGFSTFSDVGDSLLSLKVPRFQDQRILPGSVELWGLFANKWGYTYQDLLIILPAIAGFLTGIGILLLAWGIYRYLQVKSNPKFSYGTTAIALFITLGVVLSPTILIGRSYQTYDSCGPMIASYEAVGAHLEEIIPPGSKVYWQGGLSAVPLLYIKDVEIFPAQINMDYSFHFTGDNEELVKYGFWSESLSRQWVMEADYALVARRYYKDWLKETLQDGDSFEELPSPPLLASCDRYDLIHVFKRRR